MSDVRSDVLRQRIVDLTVFMATEVFQVWKQSRGTEVYIFNQQVAETAGSWDEVIALRAARDNTSTLQESFEELRDSLETELNVVVEEETKIASARIV